ncbi:MAG: hypothetical protein EOP48_08840 [Sphingobacteriales bacterium]|nr:MAG: hypothetical protein EOP48_08840 [Sphingobacteriales bacterium]
MANGKITVHNKISPHYKEVHVDGAFGGITPRGQISLSFYAERNPIPKSTDFEITEAGTVGDKITDSVDSLAGVLRQFEVGIYMDLNSAKSLVDFLSAKVYELETILNRNNDSRNSK